MSEGVEARNHEDLSEAELRALAAEGDKLLARFPDARIEAVARAIASRFGDPVFDDGERAHEAGAERNREIYRDQAAEYIQALDAVRRSPQGDTENLVKALRRLVELKDHPEHDSISPIVKREAWDAVRKALAEFSDASKEEK